MGETFPWSMQPMVREIGKIINKMCVPEPSISKWRKTAAGVGKEKHHIKKNLIAIQLTKILKKTKYKITKQIVNLYTKTIG